MQMHSYSLSKSHFEDVFEKFLFRLMLNPMFTHQSLRVQFYYFIFFQVMSLQSMRCIIIKVCKGSFIWYVRKIFWKSNVSYPLTGTVRVRIRG